MTHVINSRLQKKANRVWRRRECLTCHAIFTSLEGIVYDSSLAVQLTTSHIVPFSRDQLFLSIYDACRHRPAAVSDAAALTDTVLGKVPARTQRGLITRDEVVRIVRETLERFDKVAAVHYTAFHKLP